MKRKGGCYVKEPTSIVGEKTTGDRRNWTARACTTITKAEVTNPVLAVSSMRERRESVGDSKRIAARKRSLAVVAKKHQRSTGLDQR